MFDLRYHVASLAAVFFALVIGILVGVAMSGKVDDAEKRALKSDVNRLEAQLNAASAGRAKVSREHTALRAFIKNAYPMLIADRLQGKRVAVLFVGPVDAGVLQQIEQSISDASLGWQLLVSGESNFVEPHAPTSSTQPSCLGLPVSQGSTVECAMRFARDQAPCSLTVSGLPSQAKVNWHDRWRCAF